MDSITSHVSALLDADQDRVAETRFIRLLGSYGDDRPTIEENIINDNDVMGQKPITYRYSESQKMSFFIYLSLFLSSLWSKLSNTNSPT